jgi:hypothetical protein
MPCRGVDIFVIKILQFHLLHFGITHLHTKFKLTKNSKGKDVEKRQTNVANKLVCKTNQISFNNL